MISFTSKHFFGPDGQVILVPRKTAIHMDYVYDNPQLFGFKNRKHVHLIHQIGGGAWNPIMKRGFIRGEYGFDGKTHIHNLTYEGDRGATPIKFKKALEDELNKYPEVDREQAIKESEQDYVDMQWDYFKKLSIRIGIGILVLIVGLVIYFLNPGLGKNSENSNQSLTQQEVNDQPQEVSANYVCQNIGDLVISYQNFITKWRNVNNNMTLSDLNEYSDQASNDLRGIADEISTRGITWNSGAVVAALIINTADYIEELAAYTNRGFFAPGRYVNVILSDIDISAGAVLNSACK